MNPDTPAEQVYAAISNLTTSSGVSNEMVTHGIIIYAYIGQVGDDDAHGIKFLATDTPDWMLQGLLLEISNMITNAEQRIQNEGDHDD